jgi:hypothetical protein
MSRRDLQVAAGEVDADAVAPDQVVGRRGLQVVAAALERHHQFHFVMQVLGQRRVRQRRAVARQRVGRLGEEERRLALVLAHFLDVLQVIASDAPDPAHGKQLVAAGNRERRLGRRRNNVSLCAHEISSDWIGCGMGRPNRASRR